MASTKAPDLLHQAMHVVWYRCIAMAIKMASKVGHLFVVVLFAVALAAAEPVVAQWRRPVASGVALNMPHWAMPFVLLQCTAKAIEMADNRGAFVYYCQSFA